MGSLDSIATRSSEVCEVCGHREEGLVFLLQDLRQREFLELLNWEGITHES